MPEPGAAACAARELGRVNCAVIYMQGGAPELRCIRTLQRRLSKVASAGSSGCVRPRRRGRSNAFLTGAVLDTCRHWLATPQFAKHRGSSSGWCR